MSNWDNDAKRKNNTFTIFDDYVVVKDCLGREFIVDKKGYEMILSFDRYWRVSRRKSPSGKIEIYVESKIKNKTIKLHRFLMNPPENKVIDHIDGDGTNNRFENLREVTPQQNAMNQEIQKNNTSGIKGVHLNKRNNKWVARIAFKGERIVLGTFDNFDDAVQARKKAEEKYFGEFNRKDE